MHADVLAALACPDCGGQLLGDEGGLACTRCGRRFEVERDVPRLLPSAGLDAEWEAKQELGQDKYNEAPATAVARRFGRFVDMNGIVLDVGSGVEPRPAYLEPVEGRRGLDPLVGTARRDFDFVQGVAEFLRGQDGRWCHQRNDARPRAASGVRPRQDAAVSFAPEVASQSGSASSTRATCGRMPSVRWPCPDVEGFVGLYRAEARPCRARV